MKRLIQILLAIIVTTNASLAQKDNGEWHRVKTDHGIAFTMPENPTQNVTTQDGIPTYIYQCRDLSCVFGVVCADFNDKKEMLQPEYMGSLVELLKAGSAPKEEYGKIVAERLVQRQNPLIYEIKYTTEKDKVQWSYIKQFIITDRYIYQFNIGAKSRNTEQLQYEADLFFNSITYNEEKN